MPRNMSFALTVDSMQQRIKTVTRRQGWLFLKPNDKIQPVVKAMGLKKGEKIERIGGLIEVINIRRERINLITLEEVIREGFFYLTPDEFIEMYCDANRCNPWDECTRIEFKYLDNFEKNDL